MTKPALSLVAGHRVGDAQNTVLLVAGQKGGDGKTTAAVSLAIMRKRQGRDVLLVDADGQQNATKWVKRRADLEGVTGRVSCVSLSGHGRALAAAVKDLAGRCEDIVIDVGGFKSEEFLSAMTVAHRLISPIQSSQFDLDTMAEVDRLVGLMKAANPDLDAAWFCNMLPPHPLQRRDAINDAREALEDLTNLRPLASHLSFRQCFRLTGRGMVVDETPKSESQEKGIFELAQLNREAWHFEQAQLLREA